MSTNGDAGPAEVIHQRSDVLIRPGAEPGSVVASGSLDLLTSPLLRRALAAAIATHPDRVWLDLRGVNFIDASTVSVLVRCRRDAAAAGSEFRVTGASGIVRRVLEITGLWPLVDEA